MTSTLITLAAAFVVCGLVVLALDANRRRVRRQERAVAMRIIRYLDMSRPTRPW